MQRKDCLYIDSASADQLAYMMASWAGLKEKALVTGSVWMVDGCVKTVEIGTYECLQMGINNISGIGSVESVAEKEKATHV